ncbi:hypothetical protein BJY16_001043 [Actinoplanes octamycinicus]|uniref:Uncharacterized protein n=1 Tax=Actinoplanes octamycinicus TaxID=135948 RepID=A0A7W7M5C6_9ACTN|nr:hypothetical protein [Actinoplanes octamycinicus]MBB4737584.1 hypothetical protein [Actinoplanes octamycinicus]GIE57887.1 hypothetical protein Aoc01nite_32890 [Actinoplanes octamycinicus]
MKLKHTLGTGFIAMAVTTVSLMAGGTAAMAQDDLSPRNSIETALQQADAVPVFTRVEPGATPVRVEVAAATPKAAVATSAGVLGVTLVTSDIDSAASLGEARGFGEVAPDTDAVVRPQEDGAQFLSVMKEDSAPGAQRYKLDLPAGTQLESSHGGGFSLIHDGAEIGAVEAPWARDAAGRHLPTSYRLEGDTLIQETDVSGATFPVVADPRFSVGWGVYMSLNGGEIRTYGGAIVAIGLGGVAVGCTQVSRIPHAGLKALLTLACATAGVTNVSKIGPFIKKAFDNRNVDPNKCYQTKLAGSGIGVWHEVRRSKCD